ncbi:MAG: hypothetical protein AAAFM81_13510 [Pseudomonadota bacterium]
MQVALLTSDEYQSSIKRWLADEGHLVFSVVSATALASLLGEREIDCIIADTESVEPLDSALTSGYRCLLLDGQRPGWSTVSLPLRRRMLLSMLRSPALSSGN